MKLSPFISVIDKPMRHRFREVLMTNTKTRMCIALSYLNCYLKRRDKFLTHIVTGNKTYISYALAVSKCQSILVHQPHHKSSSRQSQRGYSLLVPKRSLHVEF